MDLNLEKRYCKNKIRKLSRNKKNYISQIDTEEKDGRQFKLDRFVKDVQAFRKGEQCEAVKLTPEYKENKNKQQRNHSNKETVLNEKVKRKRGLFDYGYITTSFTRGLLGGPNSARFDQDLRKIIGLANINNVTANRKKELAICSSQDEVTKSDIACTPPNGTELRPNNAISIIQKVDENKKKTSILEKEPYSEFTRSINHTLALEKYNCFKDDNYIREIKTRLRSLVFQRAKKTQVEDIPTTEKSATCVLTDLSCSTPLISPCGRDEVDCNYQMVVPYVVENDLNYNEVEAFPKYKSTAEFLKETLGVSSSSLSQQSPNKIIQKKKEKIIFHANFSEQKTSYGQWSRPNDMILKNDYPSTSNNCFGNYIEHPVSKLPYPQEYLENFSHNCKTSSVLCLPHPAAKYLGNSSVRPSYTITSHSYGMQRNFEDIDGCGDKLQPPLDQSLFQLPPKEPSPEFQHYPFKMF